MRGEICPISLEIGLIGACNHRCIFCSVDHLGYHPDVLLKDVCLRMFAELRQFGLKSVLFAGTGEPLLHPDFSDIIRKTKAMGIDVALSTNGVLFSEKIIDECLQEISWIRFSVSAGCEETYRKIHKAKDGDFDLVLKNISTASEYKRYHGLKTVLNVQIVMIPENLDEIVSLAREVKERGADIFVVKSFGRSSPFIRSNHKDTVKADFYEETRELEKSLMDLTDENFHVVYRRNRVNHEFSERPYSECLASDFHGFICADGNVYPCCNLVGMSQFSFGNINEESPVEIWRSLERKKVLKKLEEMKLTPCPTACKLDVMNSYLWELRNLGDHVNFI